MRLALDLKSMHVTEVRDLVIIEQLSKMELFSDFRAL